MKYSQFFVAAAMAAVADAHARVWSVAVDGVSQGNGLEAGGYIRSPPNNNPLKDLTSNDLRCNVNGGTAAAKTITVTAGAKVTVQWYHNIDNASDDIIDPSHKGPVMVYIAPTASNGAGNVWVKLAESGYSAGTWAVDTLIKNRGQHSFTVPSALANGEYLIRPEIIASHESDTAFNVNPARGAQLYMACIQIKVVSGGAVALPAGVAIPGVYTYSDPGILFNIYGGYTSYSIPGPKVWVPSAGSAPAPAPSTTLKTTTKAAAPTTTKAPVVVAPTTTKAPVVVPTTKAPVPVTTSVKPVATSVKPASTSVVKPVSSSKVACPAPSTVLITVGVPAPTGGSTASATKYGQCGGIGFTGPKTCASGSTCKVQNAWYSQCL